MIVAAGPAIGFRFVRVHRLSGSGPDEKKIVTTRPVHGEPFWMDRKLQMKAKDRGQRGAAIGFSSALSSYSLLSHCAFPDPTHLF